MRVLDKPRIACDHDFHCPTRKRAGLLRAERAGELDWEHLAEVLDLGCLPEADA